MIVGCRVFMRTPQGRATPIEIEIAIEIGKLPEIDFDYDFDIDTELPQFENKKALRVWRGGLAMGPRDGYLPCAL